MALSTGTRIGPYGVITAVGAGGMGEVYRGRDTKLSRDVALKILPEAFVTDGDRLARFRREAHVQGVSVLLGGGPARAVGRVDAASGAESRAASAAAHLRQPSATRRCRPTASGSRTDRPKTRPDSRRFMCGRFPTSPDVVSGFCRRGHVSDVAAPYRERTVLRPPGRPAGRRADAQRDAVGGGEVVVDGGFYVAPNPRTFDIWPGNRLLMIEDVPGAAGTPAGIVVMLNFVDDVKRRLAGR